jgi:adenylate cyclase
VSPATDTTDETGDVTDDGVPLSEVRAERSERAAARRANRRGRRLWRLANLGVISVLMVSNTIGAVIALVLPMFVIPLPPYRPGEERSTTFFLVSVAIYVGAALPLGIWLGRRAQRSAREWLLSGRPATLRDQRIVLRTPSRLFLVQMFFWLPAAVLFGGLSLGRGFLGGLWVATIVALAGATTAASTYLLAERILRPIAAKALSHGAQGDFRTSGVRRRAILAWVLGTGVPVGGLLAVGIVSLSTGDGSRRQVLIAVIVLSGIGVVVGFSTASAVARATAGPILGVSRALRKVQDGDLDVSVPVYDATEIGRLQVGFNAMVVGLREREKLRDAFGTYLDPEVAALILREGTDLDGEELEVTVMFIDIRGFTSYASETEAHEVVTRINQLFSTVVPIVHEHEGHIDKFVGDGLLAVFGAPRRNEHHADSALAAARAIAAAVPEVDPDLGIGIGLNSGPVVAGNVGGGGRLEFTVIGNTVNIAARVESATRDTGDDVLLSASTRELLADPPELVARDGIRLKGREGEVTLYAPAG